MAYNQPEPSVDHGLQLWKLLGREEDGGGGQAELQVGGGRLAELVGRRDKVQEVVNQLESDTEVLPVQEGILTLRLSGS